MRERAIELSDCIVESTGAGGEHPAEVVPFGTIRHPLNVSLECPKLIVLKFCVRRRASPRADVLSPRRWGRRAGHTRRDNQHVAVMETGEGARPHRVTAPNERKHDAARG